MTNHPNRATYPDHTLEDRCREAGAQVMVLWEIKGPKDTDIAWMTCYAISKGICVVQTFRQGGWAALTDNPSGDIAETVADVLQRCRAERS